MFKKTCCKKLKVHDNTNNFSLKYNHNLYSPRIKWIDFLRGIAVILMLEQHLTIWLWKFDLNYAFKYPLKYGFVLFCNGLGGLAAPIFIMLAGYSTFLLANHSHNPKNILLKRGLFIIFCGYILNLFVQHWFQLSSWYILHLIGFSIILSPLFLDKKIYINVSIAILIIVLSASAQTFLKTPLYLSEMRMSFIRQPLELLRIIFVEGHFPVFPWLSFFITGIISAQWMYKNKTAHVFFASIVCFFMAIFLILGRLLISPGLNNPLVSRLFMATIGIYPLLPPIAFLLLSITLFLVWLFHGLRIKTEGIVVALGQCSLSIGAFLNQCHFSS